MVSAALAKIPLLQLGPGGDTNSSLHILIFVKASSISYFGILYLPCIEMSPWLGLLQSGIQRGFAVQPLFTIHNVNDFIAEKCHLKPLWWIYYSVKIPSS